MSESDGGDGDNGEDLTAFRERGGKAIVWHGWADPLIYAEGTIDYYTRVRERMGGADKTASFIRLFMAPETLQAVRRDQAGAVVRSRPLCQYPVVARYTGRGSTDEAASFECRAN